MAFVHEETEELASALKDLEKTLLEHISNLNSRTELISNTAAAAAAAAVQPSVRGTDRRRRATLNNGSLRCNNESVDSTARSRDNKVPISVRVVFLKVGEIDTLRDRYAADVLVQARWREPSLDGCAQMAGDINWSRYWNPKLMIDNIYGEARESIWYSASFDGNGCATVTEKRRINGSFFEYMELNQFPFDTQDLTVTLSTERDESEIEFVEDVNERCAINSQSFVDEQEWYLHSIIHTWRKTVSESVQNVNINHPAFSAACKASRRPGFFIWNIFVVMFLICSMSFGTFSVKPDLPQNRLQLTFILLLTTVSFKFAVNQSLPMISYLTYLDKYILGSMGILCCICVWHAIIPVIMLNQDPSGAQLADKVALIVFAFTYITLHAVVVIVVVFMSRWKHGTGDNLADDQTDTGSSGDTAISTISTVHNGMIPDSYEERGNTNGSRTARNMMEMVTNQTVMSAWQ